MKHRAVGILSKINQDWCIAVRVSLGASALKGTCSLTYTVIFHIITFSSPHLFFRDTGAMKGQPYMIKKLQTLQFLLSLLGTDIPILLGREKVDFTVPPSLLSEILIRIGSVFSPF